MMTTATNPLEPLMSIEAVATVLGVSTKTIRRLVKSGVLPIIRLGRTIRVRPDDLKAHIARQRIG